MNEEPSLIFEKALFGTDVDPCLNRLSIPFNKLIRNDFLTPDESMIIEEEGVVNNGVRAILVDQQNKKWDVILKRWKVKKDIWIYVLIGGWNDIVEANGLKTGDYISLWSFRHRGILCFDLDSRRMGQSSSSLASDFSELQLSRLGF